MQQVQHQLLEVIQASGHGHVLNLMVLKTVALLRFLSKLVAVDLVIISIIMHEMLVRQTFVIMDQ